MCAEETFLIYNDKNSLLVNIFVQTMIFFLSKYIMVSTVQSSKEHLWKHSDFLGLIYHIPQS